MIHFLITYARPGTRTPFTVEVEKLGIPHRIISDHLNTSYSRRWELLLKRLPAVAMFSIRSAWTSLLSRPTPEVVVLGSDLDVLAFSIAKMFFFRRNVKLVLPGFIFTNRKSSVMRTLHKAYYRIILGQVSHAICHSELEVSEYKRIFRLSNTTFVFLPWGTHISYMEELLAKSIAERSGDISGTSYVVSAGRSGRDYQTLFSAWDGIDLCLHVICDFLVAIAGGGSDRIRLKQNCHGKSYLDELASSAFVVIPLTLSDISSGQMVLVQAMALGKACIITRTPTTTDYVQDERNALLVDPGDVAQLRRAIIRLMTDKPLRERLGRAALASFEARHTFPLYVSGVVRVAQRAANLDRTAE